MDISKIGQSVGGVSDPSLKVFQETSTEGVGSDFTAFLEKSINDVNGLLQQSDKSANELAVGKSENLHEAMINMEKAETALKLMVQVRNKALDAYNQVLQMQV